MDGEILDASRQSSDGVIFRTNGIQKRRHRKPVKSLKLNSFAVVFQLREKEETIVVDEERYDPELELKNSENRDSSTD